MSAKCILFSIAITLSTSTLLSAQVITTIAGTGTAGYSGDGGMAAAAQLNNPWGIAADDAGNLYLADRNNNCVRKVSAAGIITTIAGNGTAGYSGDGGAATAAELKSPTGVATDASGDIFIVDKDNSCLRKVTAGGIITTIAGTGTAGYSGDGSTAISAQLNNPRGIALDAAGNVYVADAGNHAVRKINTSGIITTVAGNGTAGFSGDGGAASSAQLHGPYHVAVDAAGNLFIADVDNERIRKVTATGTITTIAGTGTAGYSGDGGLATAAALFEPISVAADNAGNLYIADGWNARIRKVYASGTIATIAGTGTAGYSGDGGVATAAQLNNPYGIAIRGTTLYITDNGNSRVRSMSSLTAVMPPPPEAATLGVFPNPSPGQFTITVNESGGADITIDVFNINGTRVTSLTCTANGATTFAPALAKGVYVLRPVSADVPQLRPVTLIIQ